MACTANKTTDFQIPTKKRKVSDEEEVKVKGNKSNVDDSCKNSNVNNCNKITGIWELHSYCYRQKLEPPKYRIIETTDFSNNKSFTVQCIIRSLQAEATGRKKKEAKHKASHLLLERLKHNAKFFNVTDEDEDSLEEGEINDLEEGEIKDNKNDNEKNIIDDKSYDDIETLLKHKYKSYKIYIEGNNRKDNKVIGSNKPVESNVERLAEFCFEQKLPPPRYEINKFTGLNSFIFSCKCSVLQLMMKTNGASKVQAKEKVSLMLLNKMKQHIDIINPDNKDENEKGVDLEEGEILEDRKDNQKRCKLQIPREKKFKFNESKEPKARLHIPGMGELYTYCLKLKIPPPIYTITEKYDVSPTKTVFTCKCSVLNFSKFGKGLNKKQAKHAAAKIVLQKLQNWNKTGSCQDDYENDLLEDGKLTTKEVQVKDEYVKHKLENNFISYEEKILLQLQCIAERHNIIKTGAPYTDSGIIKKLKEADDEFLKKHAIVILNHLCKELDCNYSFVELKSPMYNITTLFINSVPPWSTFGRGNSLLEAQVESAAKLLKFFKNMSI